MSGEASRAVRPDAALVAALERAHIHPLWVRYKEITPLHPKARDGAMIWRWGDVAPFADRAAREVPIADIERRALIMVNPAFGGRTMTTANLIAAFTVLDPGDKAPPHRHVAAAIRFATRAEGAVTIVNGRRCAMQPGDLILTPPMCWHGHINESDHRTTWFDGANIPLINDLDANFFEPGNHETNDFWHLDEGEERLWAHSGIVGADVRHETSHAPKYRYPGAATRALLADLAPGPDGARRVRYVNPLTGGSIMPTLDCYALRIGKGTTMRPKRVTYNAVCLVVEGEGRSTIGETTFSWSKHDVFSIPHWQWASHSAFAGDADLFLVTDRAVHERLDLVREEMQ